MSITLEQVTAALSAAQQRIRPAQLSESVVDAERNGVILSNYMASQEPPLPPTTDGFHQAIRGCFQKLRWKVKPAKLVAEEENAAKYRIKSASSENDFAAKVKAGEAADAQKKLDEASIRQAKSLIASYLPIRNTPRGDVVDYGDQSKMQAEWNARLNQAIAGELNLQTFTEKLATTIREKYIARERAKERV
jgi:hypothetical protein